MPRLEKQHIVQHSAQDMFDLVCDIEKYPEFVPLCQSLRIKSRKEKAPTTLMLADMTMAYNMLSETFTTQVVTNSDDLSIDVKYIDGPFKRLDNEWRFEVLGEGECQVHFMIDYKLRNQMLAMAAGMMFDAAFGSFVDAFEARAKSVYG